MGLIKTYTCDCNGCGARSEPHAPKAWPGTLPLGWMRIETNTSIATKAETETDSDFDARVCAADRSGVICPDHAAALRTAMAQLGIQLPSEHER